MASILLIQSDPQALAHLTAVIGSDSQLALVAAVDTLARARASLAKRTPDLLISDLRLSDGPFAELLGELRFGRSHTLVTAGSLTDPYLIHTLRQGADAYVLAGKPDHTLLELIHQVLSGESPIAPVIARQMLTYFDADAPEWAGEQRTHYHKLGAVERRVLEWTIEGYAPEEIARGLVSTPRLVGLRVRRLYRQMHLELRARDLAARVR